MQRKSRSLSSVFKTSQYSQSAVIKTLHVSEHCYAYGDTHSHVVERYPHSVGEVFTEKRDLGITLAEVVQHDELGVHPHADSDGLGGCAVRKHGALSQRFTLHCFLTKERVPFNGNTCFLWT